MYKTIILSITFCALLLSCDKQKDLGSESVEVSVQLTNKISGSTGAVEEQKVYVHRSGEDSFLFYEVTDEDGNCTFSGLHKNVEYELKAEKKIEGLTHSATSKSFYPEDADAIELVMTYDESFSKVEFYCVDSSGFPIPTVDVCLYNSPVLADSGDCSVSLESGVSDNDGLVRFIGLDAGTYQLTVRDTVGFIPIYFRSSFSIATNGTLTDSLEIIP